MGQPAEQPEGFAELLAFLRERRYVLPGPKLMTLNELRKALPVVPVRSLLKHFPSINAGIHAASKARMLAGGKR